MNSEDKNQEHALRSVFTDNLPGILKQLGISLAVSTYQAGKLILVRRDGDKINTHFRNFERPMGIAVKTGRMSIGCLSTVQNFQNAPELIGRFETLGNHDACYVPRTILHTGSIDIHEMAWGQDNLLWGVNTRFSCLCNFDFENSFVPRWRPGFLSTLIAEDRCHLNGLAMVNGDPRFVTALGKTDTAGGWRKNKRDGGLLMDVVRNSILYEHLSMPHSPRWYNNTLWMLESGRGSLVRFDQKTGEKIEIVRVPGFTRGMDFVGPLAFIGLSKVRETAAFSDFPLLEELEERICGVYVVNIEAGKVIGFVRFEGDVEEIFAVQVFPHRFPEFLEPHDEMLKTTYMVPEHMVREFQAGGTSGEEHA